MSNDFDPFPDNPGARPIRPANAGEPMAVDEDESEVIEKPVVPVLFYIKSLLDKREELEREIEQLREMIKR